MSYSEQDGQVPPMHECEIPLTAEYQWTCPTCGAIWEFVCDMEDGPYFETVGRVEKSDAL